MASFDYNGTTVLARANVDDTARAFNDFRSAKRWLQNVAGQKVELADQCFFAFRLNGHLWTNILGRDRMAMDFFTTQMGKMDQVALMKRFQEIQKLELNRDDARELSLRLKTRAIFFGNSDTACALGYEIFENGTAVEKLETDEGYKISKWESSLHTRDEVGEKVQAWVQNMFEENDAFAPGLNFLHLVGYLMHNPGDPVTMTDGAKDFERIDFTAL